MEDKIILHRGYKGKYPENSRKAFENAINEGKSFETDIRMSKDGVCFMIHDESINRLFNGSGKVSEMTSQELKDFRYKEDETQELCPLKQMCELIKNNPGKSLIFIHIKELKDINAVIETLNQYDFTDRIRFFAVDEINLDSIEIIKKYYSDYKVGLYFSDNSEINKGEFEGANFIWADEKTDKENITERLVNFAHDRMKPVYVISPELIPESSFNSDTEKRWRELLDANVDGICTDLPQEFGEFLIRTRV